MLSCRVLSERQFVVTVHCARSGQSLCATHEIRARAREQGFITLADDGLRRVLNGTTSLEELGRVVDLTDRM